MGWVSEFWKSVRSRASALRQQWLLAERQEIRRQRQRGPVLERLIVGEPGNAPEFMRRYEQGLVEAYGRGIGMLLQAVLYVYPSVLLRLLFRRFCEAKAIRDTSRRFEALLDIDAQLLAALPDDVLMARRWLLIERFKRIAPARADAAYEASLPASTDKGSALNIRAVRADLINLTNYMQQLYVMNVQREQTLASIKWWLLTRAMAVSALVALVIAVFSTPMPGGWRVWLVERNAGMPLPTDVGMAPGLALVFLMGLLGAFVSIGRKFQDIARQNVLQGDPFNEITALSAGRQSVAISILSGGVFALLAYLLIAGGVTGELGVGLKILPVPAPEECSTSMKGGLATIGKGVGFCHSFDMHRMMVVAFFAGFAERFVPDAIDKLISREKQARGG